jgi:hypothetical protein
MRCLVNIGGNRFGARIVGLMRCIRASVITRVILVPWVYRISFNG